MAFVGPAQPVRYLFIDGGCVRGELASLARRYAPQHTLKVDFNLLARQIAAFDKVFYYDAVPLQEPDEDDATFAARTRAIREEHDVLRMKDGFHVYEGDLRRSARGERRRQKKIDVSIAVDMLTHTFRRNMQRATLLASDVDFEPLLHALVQEGMFVELWYPAGSTNRDLAAAADRRIKLTPVQLLRALTPDSSAVLPLPREIYRSILKGLPTLREFPHGNGRSAALHREEDGSYSISLGAPAPTDRIYFTHQMPAILSEYLSEVHGLQIPPDLFG